MKAWYSDILKNYLLVIYVKQVLTISIVYSLFSQTFFSALITPCSSGNVCLLEDTDFTILHITGRLPTHRPPICRSHKNIYRITFYREISQFLSTNSRLTQNIYHILKLRVITGSKSVSPLTRKYLTYTNQHF